MSKDVDTKIVEMQFQNSQFQQKASQTLEMLGKLSNAASMSGAVKGFGNLDKAVNNVDLSGLSSSIQDIQKHFSTAGIIADTVLRDIVHMAERYGMQIVNALVTKPLNAGFGEYNLKMGSVQTIMASTGESIETVNGYLEELNKYSDQTIYSFSDMTNNIGKFTNAGVKLEDAVLAIKGISNEAALSGANAQEASRAMYNFSQALASGYVKLIDWKSIENANMATKGFKDELLKTAAEVGTLTKLEGELDDQGNQLYRTTKGNLVSATKEFNNTLQDAWLTTDVLIPTLGKYADETTEIGQKAFHAAQDIKTIPMLFDTLGEALGSGWAQSFEIIIGDLEEAKEMLTSVGNLLGDMISKSADARNAVLQRWSDLGGREDISESIHNLIYAYNSIVEPLKRAFRDIFPVDFGKRLKDITQWIENFTKNLQVIGTKQQKMEQVFRGVFAVIDIVIQGVKVLWSVVKSFFGGVSEAVSPVGDVLVTISKYLVIIDDIVHNGIDNVLMLNRRSADAAFFLSDEALKLRDLYLKAVEFLDQTKEKLKPLTDALQKFWDKFKEILDSIFKKKDEETPLDDVAADAEKTVTFLDKLKRVASGIGRFFLNFGTMIINVFTSLMDFVSPLVTAIGNGLQTLWASIKETFTTDAGTIDFQKIFEGLFVGGLGAGIGVLIKRVSDFLNGDGGLIKTIKDAVDSLTGIFKKSDVSGVETMREFAKSLLILAAAIFILASVEPEELAASVMATGILMNSILKFIMAVSTMGVRSRRSMKAAASSLIKVAAAILILSVAMKLMASLDIQQLVVSMIAMVILLKAVTTVITSLSKIEKFSKGTSQGIKSILAVAAAVLLLTVAVKTLSKLSIEELAKGIGSVIILLAALAGFIVATNKKGMKFGKAAGILLIAASLLIINKAVKDLGALDLVTLAKGIGGVVIILAALAGFTAITKKGSKGMLVTAAAMVVLGAALLIVTNAITQLGSLSLNQWALGITGMALAVGVMTAALMLLSQIDTKRLLGVSAAMLVFSLALLTLTPAIMAFAKLSIGEIAKALLTLVGIFAILGLAAAVLEPMIPAILGVAAAVALLGVGIAAFGAGLLLLATAITAVSIAAASVPGAVLAIGAAIVGLIPIVIGAIGQIILGIINFVHEAIPAIIELLADIIIAICTAIIEAVPSIIAALAAIFDAVLPFLGTYVPAIVNLGLELVAALLVGLGEKLPDIIEAGANLIIKFLEGIGEKLPDIVMAGLDMVVKIIEGINQGIREKGDDIVAGALEIAGSLISALVRGISDGAGRIWQALKDGISDAWNGAKEWLGINSPSRKFRELGKYSAEGFAVGAESVNLAEAGETMAKSIEQGAENGIEDSREGLNDRLSKLSEWLESNIDSAPVIAPVLDLSNVSAGVGDINTMLGNIDGSGIDFGTTGFDLGGMTSSIGKPLGSTNAVSVPGQNGTTDQSTSITNTFNITGDNPQDIANEISTILQRQYDRRNAVWA